MRLVGILLFLSLFTITKGQNIYLSNVKNIDSVKELQGRILHVDSEFVLISSATALKGAILIDSDGFKEGYVLALIKYRDQGFNTEINTDAHCIVKAEKYSIYKIKKENIKQFGPFKDASVIWIEGDEYKLPSANLKSTIELKYSAEYAKLLQNVNVDSIFATIKKLQDYGTRDAYKPESVQAQNWIMQKYKKLGYVVEEQSFSTAYGTPSNNIIALKKGKLVPDEYIVLGGHSDSYARGGAAAPGADDNASGTAGVLEIARILKDVETDRSIIFCAFSAEEYGLFGSAAYAKKCSSENKNILGYFNLDMIGYKSDTDSLHTDLIYPSTAEPLAEFYRKVAKLYMPAYFGIGKGKIVGGDSDHTSFNRNGIMGIFPSEDDTRYSPYIHTTSDIIGKSVNSSELAKLLTQSVMAASLHLSEKAVVTNTDYIYSGIEVYPNPVSNILTVKKQSANNSILKMFGISGIIVKEINFSNEISLDVSDLERGLYFVKIEEGNNVYVQKVIKN